MRSTATIAAILFSAPLWADSCDELPKPSVMIKRIEEKLIFNTQYSYKSLSNIGAALARPGNQVLGLTRGNASVSFATNSPTFTDRTGRWECTSPQITVTYGLSPITVYVAREFPEGSCAYKEIYEHEMRHVKTYQAHIAEIEKSLLDTLSARFSTGSPWRGPAGQTSAKLQQELNERWTPFVQRELKRVEEAQAKIDTPEEYERVANACDGEIKKRIR
ncbi:MAG: hypothetical protein RLZZ298_1429 [Pseudomonadota bacterium]|jgi:hypothetical protein